MVNAEVGILSLLDDFVVNKALIWIIVALIIFVDFLWELITDAVEHYFDKKHKHIVVMLEKLYKELTMLGLWSVALYVFSSIVGPDHPLSATEDVIKLIHLSLFGLVLLFVGVMVFVAGLSLIMFRRWRNFEEYDQTHIQQIKDDFSAYKHYVKNTHVLLRIVNIVKLVKGVFILSHHNYFVVREHFIKQIGLCNDFRFDRYLIRAMKGTFIELAQVHWSVLGIVLVLQLCIWMAFSITFPDHLGIPYTVIGVFSFFAFLILHWKIEFVYYDLIDKPSIWGGPPPLLPDEHFSSDPDIANYQVAHLNYHHEHQSDIVIIITFFRLIFCKYHVSTIKKFLKPSPHQSLFWFGSPFLYLYLLQIALFWQACIIALTIGSLCSVIHMNYYYHIFVIFAAVANLLYFLPLLLYHYSFSTNVGGYTKRNFLIEVVEDLV